MHTTVTKYTKLSIDYMVFFLRQRLVVLKKYSYLQMFLFCIQWQKIILYLTVLLRWKHFVENITPEDHQRSVRDCKSKATEFSSNSSNTLRAYFRLNILLKNSCSPPPYCMKLNILQRTERAIQWRFACVPKKQNENFERSVVSHSTKTFSNTSDIFGVFDVYVYCSRFWVPTAFVEFKNSISVIRAQQYRSDVLIAIRGERKKNRFVSMYITYYTWWLKNKKLQHDKTVLLDSRLYSNAIQENAPVPGVQH